MNLCKLITKTKYIAKHSETTNKYHKLIGQPTLQCVKRQYKLHLYFQKQRYHLQVKHKKKKYVNIIYLTVNKSQKQFQQIIIFQLKLFQNITLQITVQKLKYIQYLIIKYFIFLLENKVQDGLSSPIPATKTL